ncbi:LysR substrate-binding domain-containing protein [Paracoccus methylarcula]|uniref:LysR substrate-binding domain-containing protein n=1 Tax=Paracoccus methylarcula TaxID=72022 RepID=UPI0024821E92|nr:LysR substrate-binding domain-containing protein [Paracoccus methylarcula]
MAARGHGAGLLPLILFRNWVALGRLAQPFAEQVDAGGYWLTRLQSSPETSGQRAFREWLVEMSG